MGTLILLRHGQSAWNLENRFTGSANPDLTEQGEAEARKAGQVLRERGIVPDRAFTSALLRAQHTLALVQEELGTRLVPTCDAALNERDYGELTGMNKDEARETFGEEQVHVWRRSFDVAPPGGESLKDTAARVLPYYEEHIAPLLREGKKVLVVAHGNSLRALIMVREGLSEEEIVAREVGTGEPIVYA